MARDLKVGFNTLDGVTIRQEECSILMLYISPTIVLHTTKSPTVRTGIIGPRARTLELPLLVRSGSFFFFFCFRLGLRGSVFAVRSPPYPREGISDFKVSGPIIPVLTVSRYDMISYQEKF